MKEIAISTNSLNQSRVRYWRLSLENVGELFKGTVNRRQFLGKLQPLRFVFAGQKLTPEVIISVASLSYVCGFPSYVPPADLFFDSVVPAATSKTKNH